MRAWTLDVCVVVGVSLAACSAPRAGDAAGAGAGTSSSSTSGGTSTLSSSTMQAPSSMPGVAPHCPAPVNSSSSCSQCTAPTWTCVTAGMPPVFQSTLAFNPHVPGELLAGSLAERVSRLRPQSGVWTMGRSGPSHGVDTLLLDPDCGDVMLTATVDGVFRSSDGGDTWTRVDTGAPGVVARLPRLAQGRQDANLVVAFMGEHGMQLSQDRGATWTPRTWPASQPAMGVAILAGEPQTILGTGEGGVWSSQDGGASWTLRSMRDGFMDITAHPLVPGLAWASGPTGSMEVTRDGGATWEALWLMGPAGPLPIQSAVFSESNPDLVLAATADAVLLRSMDGGRTWEPAGLTRAPHDGVLALAVDPHNDLVMAVATQKSGVWLTRDGGGTWVTVEEGLPRLPLLGMAQSPGDGHVLARGLWDAYLVKDGHAQTAHGPWDGQSPVPSQFLARWGAGSGVLALWDGLAVDSDAQPAGFTQVQGPSVRWDLGAVDPATGRTFLAAGRALWLSDDGGTTLRKIQELPAANWASALVHPFTHALFMLSLDGNILTNAHGDDPLAPVGTLGIPEGTQVLALAGGWKSAALYAGTSNAGVYRRDEGSSTWRAANSGLPPGDGVESLAVDALDDRVAYAGARGGGVFRTGDAGASWVRYRNGLDGDRAFQLLMDGSVPAKLWAASLRNGVCWAVDDARGGNPSHPGGGGEASSSAP